MILLKFLGLWLMTDGFLSLILVVDKHWKWQMARIFRIFIGLVIFFV